MHRLTALSLRHPKATAAILLAVTLVFAAGLPRLRTEFGFRVLLGGSHPAIVELEALIEKFGGGLPVQVAWLCGPSKPCANVFDDSSLTMANALVDRLRPLEGVRAIQGLPTAPLLVPSPNGFEIRRMVENGEPRADETLVSRALLDPLFAGRFVSEDATLGVIVIQPYDTRSDTELRVIEGLQRELEPFEAQGFEFFLVGHAASAVVAGRALAGSMALIVPLTVIVILAVLVGLLRSWFHAVVAVLMLGVALVWTFGLLGWLGWPRDAVLEVLAPLILAIGICDAVHFFSIYSSLAEPFGTRRDRIGAIRRASYDVSAPCTTTSVTTMLAFSSFCLSDLDTFVRFGTASTFGVFACLLLTFTLLPIAASRIPIARRPDSPGIRSWDALLLGILRVSGARPRTIVFMASLLAAICAVGWATRLEVDTYWYELVGEDSQIARSIRLLEERLSPTVGVEVELALPESATLAQPDALEVVDRFAESLSEIDGLGSPTSILDFLSRLNRLLNGDDPGAEHFADTAASNAELIDLIGFESSELLDHWVSFDRSSIRVSVPAREMSNAERLRVLHALDERIEELLPPDWSVLISGGLPMDHTWTRDIQTTQLRSFPAAFLLVFATVSLFLRSARLGIAAMVPTLLPVVVTLGAMAWMGMSLDVGRAMIAAVIIGIAVDDSIHLLAQYRRYRMEGELPRAAIGHAVLHVGRAVVTTSLALSLGFLTLTLSAWQTISSFGFFAALSILVALAATLFLLPALIFVFGGSDQQETERFGHRPGLTKTSKRTVLTLVATAPVVGALLLAGFGAMGPGPRVETACWVLPVGRAALLPGPHCPLEPHDEVREVRWPEQMPVPVIGVGGFQRALAGAPGMIEVAVLNGTEKVWHALEVKSVSSAVLWSRVMLAALLSGLFLCLPMLVVRRSTAPAIVPFSLFYSAFAVITVAVIAARDSVWLNRAALLATSMGPAILSHFSLTFPRRRRIVEESPGILIVPYAACALFFPVAWLAMEHKPLLWPAVVYLLIAIALAAWFLLVLSCAFSVRESDSPVERTRARMLLWGAVLPAMVGFVLAARVVDGALATLAMFLALSIGLIPLPIGVAVSRYNLFDLGNEVRSWVGQAVFYLTGGLFLTGIFAVVMWLSRSARIVDDLPMAFVFSVAAVVALEPIRGRLLGWMEGLLVPQVERLRKLQGAYVREMAELREEQEVLRLLGETIEKALQPRSGCVFLASGEDWEPAYPFGEEPPARLSLLNESLAALGDRNLVQVADTADAPIEPTVSRLIGANVAAVAALRHDSELLSVVLLSSPRTSSSYTSLELDFIQVATAHASMALRNARTASALLAAEREVSKGRTALALAHEVSKDVGLIRTLAKRMNGRPSDARRVSRDLAMVEDLSCELERRIRGFVRGATHGGERFAGTILLGDVVSRAARVAARSHGAGRVTESIEPSLRPVRVSANFERILLNLLDNALLASSGADAVHLYATREGNEVRVSVSDRGCGMTAAEREGAFELGYTTRGESGGLGVGLAVSRDIAEGLGGALELEEGPSGGTTATVRVPAVGA